MPQAHLRLIIDAGNEKNARTVLDRFCKIVKANIADLQPYHKGEFEARLTEEIPSSNWHEQVVFVLALAQTFGHGWHLGGDIGENIDMSASELKRPGLTFTKLYCSRS